MPTADAIIWLCLFITFIVLEAVTVQIVSIWFCLGSLAALIATFFNAPLWLQILIFFGVSILALAITRPLIKKYIKPKIVPTNADAIIGKTAIVTETVDNDLATGYAKVSGILWTARSETGEIIPADSKALVTKIEGVKIYIKKIEE